MSLPFELRIALERELAPYAGQRLPMGFRAYLADKYEVTPTAVHNVRKRMERDGATAAPPSLTLSEEDVRRIVREEMAEAHLNRGPLITRSTR